MKLQKSWINQVFFQLSWYACVVGAANGFLWPAVVVVGLFAVWQLHPARMHPRDPFAVGAFVVAGLLIDTLWLRLGIVEYAMAWPSAGFIPAWLLLLWLALGMTVNHSLGVFRTRWRLFVLLATVGSPMSYSVAAGFGAVTWVAPSWLVIACMGPVWALAVGLLFRLAGIEGPRQNADGQTVEVARG